LENLVHQDHLVFLEIQEDQESLEKKDLQVPLAHKEDLVYLDHLDYLDSLEKEDCLDYLVCLV